MQELIKRIAAQRWMQQVPYSALAVVGTFALLSAAGVNGSAAQTPNHYPADAGFENDLESIIAAAENEPPLHECNSFSDEEWEVFYGPFRDRFPNIAEIERTECGGIGQRERIFAEWSTGRYDVGLVTLADDQMSQFLDADMGAKPDWSVFDGTELEFDPGQKFDSSGKIYSMGNTSRVIVYNPELISYDELPDSLYECADPKYKGRLMVDIRPATSYAMFPILYGEEKTREWARKIKENEPLWVRSSTPTTTALLAGERAFVCAVQLHAPFRVDGVVWEEGGVFPPGQALHAKAPTDNAHDAGRFSNMIAKYPEAPNTAMLWSAWILSGNTRFLNPGHEDAWDENSWKHQWFKNQGVEVNQYPGGRYDAVKNTELSTQWIVDEWGNLTPDRQ